MLFLYLHFRNVVAPDILTKKKSNKRVDAGSDESGVDEIVRQHVQLKTKKYYYSSN